MSDKPRITCRGVDITEHVAAMYDAIVGSMDWGSCFLNAEEIESILTSAELTGYDVPDAAGGELPPELNVSGKRWSPEHGEALRRWRAQIKAKAQAMLEDADDPDMG